MPIEVVINRKEKLTLSMEQGGISFIGIRSSRGSEMGTTTVHLETVRGEEKVTMTFLRDNCSVKSETWYLALKAVPPITNSKKRDRYKPRIDIRRS